MPPFLQIVVTQLKEEPWKPQNWLTAYYVSVVEPKDKKQIFAANLAAERGLVMQSALMENIKGSVPGWHRSCDMLSASASQNLCPTLPLELALTKSDQE